MWILCSPADDAKITFAQSLCSELDKVMLCLPLLAGVPPEQDPWPWATAGYSLCKANTFLAGVIPSYLNFLVFCKILKGELMSKLCLQPVTQMLAGPVAEACSPKASGSGRLQTLRWTPRQLEVESLL